MNYFFVHTPFQLIVAQGIIKKEQLENNVLLLGHTGSNAERQQAVLEEMIINSLWIRVNYIGDLHMYIPNLSNPMSFLKARKSLNKLKNFIERLEDTQLYFGDLNAIAYIIILKFLKVKRIFFFEEGISHYTLALLNPKASGSFVKGKIYDFLCRRVLRISSMSQYIFNTTASEFDFSIMGRYNILKREIQQNFDQSLDLKYLLQYGVNTNFIKDFKDLSKSNVIIFLSSTIRNFFDDCIEAEIHIVKKLVSLYPGKNIIIKFHPKDNMDRNQAVLKGLRSHNIPVMEINIRSEVPIELLFNIMEPSGLFGYGSSAQLYYTEFSKKTPNINVLDLLEDEFIKKQSNFKKLQMVKSNWSRMKEKYL